MSFVTKTETEMRSVANKFSKMFDGDADSWEYLTFNELEQKLTQEELIVLAKQVNDALHYKVTRTANV